MKCLPPLMPVSAWCARGFLSVVCVPPPCPRGRGLGRPMWMAALRFALAWACLYLFLVFAELAVCARACLDQPVIHSQRVGSVYTRAVVCSSR